MTIIMAGTITIMVGTTKVLLSKRLKTKEYNEVMSDAAFRADVMVVINNKNYRVSERAERVDYSVDVDRIPCPTCGVGVNERCKSMPGTSHKGRIYRIVLIERVLEFIHERFNRL